jgi:DNA-binding XRE family transcriptional regulator
VRRLRKVQHVATRDPFFDAEDVRALVREWQIQCGARVKARRELFNWDRRTFAAITGTTEPTIQRVEAGVVNPRDYLRLIIAACLACEVADLWPYPTQADVHSNAKRVG